MYTFWSTATQDPVMIWTKAVEGGLSTIVLDTLKTWIHRPLEDNFWNAEASALIRVAQRAIERRFSLSLAQTTWVGRSNGFPTTILQRPFLGVTLIEYIHPDTGEVITLPTDQYVVAPGLQYCGQILPPRNVIWPECAERPDSVRITVTTGFSDLPEDMVHAMMMTIAALDSNRGDGGGGGGSHLDSTVYGATHASGPSIIPAGAMALLAPFAYRSFLSV